MSVLDALVAETRRTGDFLATLSSEDWDRPTRCPPMVVLDLAAHAWRGGQRIVEMVAAGPVDSEPEKDGVTYFRYDPAAIGPEVVARAQAVAAEHDAKTFAGDWRQGWAEALDAAAVAMEKGDGVYDNVFGGLMRMSEYLRTRVLEVAIHTMDLRHAVGLSPDPTEAGLMVTCDVLRGLLGTDLRSLGVDDVRFALVGTGREPLSESEWDLLGPLVEKFPLLA
ncbi:MAG: maleylpyruvate isomerase N-terminal domain-containing protein [Actinomycetota bacterium]